MGAHNHTAADVQWGGVPCTDIQMVNTCAGGDDIDDRVHCADFMKMNLVDRDIMNLGLGVAEQLEHTDGSPLDRLF